MERFLIQVNVWFPPFPAQVCVVCFADATHKSITALSVTQHQLGSWLKPVLLFSWNAIQVSPKMAYCNTVCFVGAFRGEWHYFSRMPSLSQSSLVNDCRVLILPFLSEAGIPSRQNYPSHRDICLREFMSAPNLKTETSSIFNIQRHMPKTNYQVIEWRWSFCMCLAYSYKQDSSTIICNLIQALPSVKYVDAGVDPWQFTNLMMP